MNGLCLASSCGVGNIYVRVHKGRFGLQNKIRSVLMFAAKLRFTERELRSLSTNIVELANEGRVSTGLHARRVTGLPEAEREESFTRTESMAR